ncbi:MAG: transposase, partial [Nitrospirae bacterium]|nr:transposase [Fimbriimonadaceae bacterium]
MMRRSFTREFKLDVCRRAESGESSKSRLCREHALSPSMLDRWIEQFRAKGEEAFDGAAWRSAS